MASVFRVRWVQVGAGATLGAVLAAAITLFATSSASSGLSAGDHVSLTSGGAVRASTEEPGFGYLSEVISEELPLTAAEAVAAGWTDPVLCDPGRGRYFRKGTMDDAPPYFLMYDSKDQLTGVYLFVSSEGEMPAPWAKWDELNAGDLPIIDYAHWSLLVYFRDATRACETHDRSRSESAWSGGSASGVRSTPTPVLPPTPTPTASVTLEAAVAKMSALTALTISFTSEPEGPPFAGDILPGNIVDVVEALEDPAETANKWIDNQPHRGFSGTVRGDAIKGLVPAAAADATATLTLWVSDSGEVRRLQIEGAVTPDDPPDAVRVLDIGGEG